MKAITINYNETKDLTTISLSKDFQNSVTILQADILKDALHELTEIYNEAVGRIGRDTAHTHS